MPLDTLSNAKSVLLVGGSGDDTMLAQLLDAADSFIEKYTGRSFAGGTFTETHPAGGPMLFLRNFPVASVTSLKVDADRAFGSGTERTPPPTRSTPTAASSNRGRGRSSRPIARAGPTGPNR